MGVAGETLGLIIRGEGETMFCANAEVEVKANSVRVVKVINTLLFEIANCIGLEVIMLYGKLCVNEIFDDLL